MNTIYVQRDQVAVYPLFIADSLTYTRRTYIHLNSIFNSITIDIDKSELDSRRNMSLSS